MSDQSRLFEAGPDPFGRMWKIQFRWLQTGISIRHADTVDVKFFVTADGGESEEKVIALPHPALLQLTSNRGRKLTDSYCRRLAAAHLRHMIETSEDIEQTLVTLTPEELAAYDRELSDVTVLRQA
ncbi:MAG: hypothetical protein JO033_18705 [Acidobacteriaceae bacterium]|nr:hypothetical protein [Acidobacteriaceae bacterium]MBV9500532.1 hypothetical protein [Acidobacteriaceae bacterium]